MGKQAQVDMGEIILETMTGRHKKIYCFAMVMTHSRQKFSLWQEKPFTTDSFIQAHMRAFAYYGGRPIEIVYDQDKILAVSENHGDIIYTEGFQNYVNTVRFDIFLCLMRLKDSINIAKKCKGDFITSLPGKPSDNTDDITIRVIEVTLDNGTKEYLATNLFDENITQEMFRELYFYRWPVELKYKELKSRLAIEEFNGATTTSIFQEFFINLLLSNLSSLIKNAVDDKINITAKDTNKYRYQANRAIIIGRMKKCVPKILCDLCDLGIIEQLFEEAYRCRSQIIPGRSFRRKKNKAVGRTHFRNKKVSF